MLEGKVVTIEVVRDELTAVEEQYKAQRGPLRALLKALIAQKGVEQIQGEDDDADDDTND